MKSLLFMLLIAGVSFSATYTNVTGKFRILRVDTYANNAVWVSTSPNLNYRCLDRAKLTVGQNSMTEDAAKKAFTMLMIALVEGKEVELGYPSDVTDYSCWINSVKIFN